MSWSQKFGKSIFSEITELAIKHKAINLAQGFPDFDGPEEMKAEACAAINGDQETGIGMNQYAPSIGVPILREKLAKRYRERFGLNYSEQDEITVVSGCTEAIFVTIMALHGRGDEIVTFEPFYDSYEAVAEIAGVSIRPVRLHAPDWNFKLEDLEAAITNKTKSIILNTPHNPTGKVFTQSEMEAIAGLAKKHDLIVITDEVYEELLFDGHQHFAMASLPGMRERTVVMSSAAKTFSMTGWKIGYILAPQELSREIRTIHQFVVFCSATPLQYGIARALDFGEAYYKDYIEGYTRRRDLLCEVLNGYGFDVYKPQGSYFIVAGYDKLSSLPDREFCEQLIKEVGVAAIPTSPFYQDKDDAARNVRQLRFAFCKDEQTIREAGKLLT